MMPKLTDSPFTKQRRPENLDEFLRENDDAWGYVASIEDENADLRRAKLNPSDTDILNWIQSRHASVMVDHIPSSGPVVSVHCKVYDMKGTMCGEGNTLRGAVRDAIRKVTP